MDKVGYVEKIKALSNKYGGTIIGWRRRLHEHPELSFEEYETSAFISARLDEIGCKVTRNVGGTGVTGLLDTKRPGPVIAFRADMDALPISESDGVPFASKKPGVMHACGHDAHMAIILGLAKLLSECVDELNGTIKFIFQPGEEANGGARRVIEAGALENPSVEAIFALHMVPDLLSGTIGVRSGYVTATDDNVIIRVKGVNAHSSAPQEGVNAVLLAAHIVTALQTISSTRISPFDIATFSICTIKGGEAQNVIPDYAEMTGMIRCIKKTDKLIFRENIRKICLNTAQALGGSAEVEFIDGYPAVYNDKKYTKILMDSSAMIMDEADIIEIPMPHMGSEDFSYYQEQIPGVMFMLGSNWKDGRSGPLHSPAFNICEDSIPLGLKLFASLAFTLCAGETHSS